MRGKIMALAMAGASVFVSVQAEAAVTIASINAWGDNGAVEAIFTLPPGRNNAGGNAPLDIGVGVNSLSVNVWLLPVWGAIFEFDRALDLTQTGTYNVVGGTFAFREPASGIPGFTQILTTLTGGTMTLRYSDANPNEFYNATFQAVPEPAQAVPEPATWAMMIAGFGLAGAALRNRRRVNVKLPVGRPATQ